MNWETLTAPAFAKAVQNTGVCVVAMGVVEKHGDHLPLGTDFLNGHKLATLAAEQEPAVVFPPFYFGQIYEARCFPGALTLPPELLLSLLRTVLREIRRNGFKKIILVNAHGGNTQLLDFLAQCTLAGDEDYALYVHKRVLPPDRKQQWEETIETTVHGHACECETSISLANHPQWVDMDAVPDEPALPLGRSSHLTGHFSGISWYSDFPEHYAGDARTAAPEKGRILRQLQVDTLAAFIAEVKADQAVPTLTSEFFERERQLRE